MCILCSATTVFDPSRHGETEDPFSATISENSGDAAGNTTTIYGLQVGDTFNGTLSTFGDDDWVEVTLQAGQTYEFALNGNSLSDPYVRLYDSSGSFVSGNDDGGPGLDSLLTYTAQSSGTYYVSARAYADRYTGSYSLSFSQQQPPQVGTLDELADYLTDGFWSDFGTVERSFNTSNSNVITVNITRLTAEGQQLARWAFDAWEMVANLQFVETTSSSARIRFDDNAGGLSAYATSSLSGTTINYSNVMVTTDWLTRFGTTMDSYSFATYIHEIGHAIGLGHQGGYNGSAIYGRDEEFANDSWQLSVMSYFDQLDNTSITASYAAVVTPMMADIIAAQNLYGAPGASSATSGDTTWGDNSSLGNYLDSLFALLNTDNSVYAGNPVTFTIYDRDGVDTVDVTSSTTGDRISLIPTQFSDIGGLIGNVGIARGTILENVLAGSGNDTITGNNYANNIQGNGGNDSILGNGGWDTILGGNGRDTLLGQAGADALGGGNGHDALWGGDHNDTLSGDAGNDTLGGGNGNDVMSGGQGNDLLGGGLGRDSMWGGDNNDTIRGWADIDLIRGGSGEDVLIGGNWGDTIYGNAGNDVIYGDSEFGGTIETGQDFLSGDAGNDTIYGGGGADTILGGADNDVIFGHDGWNQMYGGAGNDRLTGGAQTDRLVGETGNDTMTGNGSSDVFLFRGNIGTDRITDFSLAENDRLALDDAMWSSAFGSLTTAQIVSQFAAPGASGFVEFNLPTGRIILEGITSTTGLESAIDII